MRCVGEALSPLPLHSANHPPEGRFQSDFAIARDDRSACSWQGFINQQDKMTSAFKRAMAKLALIGQDEHKLITCSSVIPEPVPASGKPATSVTEVLRTVKDADRDTATRPRRRLQTSSKFAPYPSPTSPLTLEQRRP